MAKGTDDFDRLVAALASGAPETRRGAAESLGRLGDPAAIPILAAAVARDTDSLFRQRAMDALVRIGEPSVDTLIEMLGSSDRDLAFRAAMRLGSIGDARAIAPLIALLEDPAEWIRDATAASLGSWNDGRVIEALERARDDPSERVRKAAARSLRRLTGEPGEMEGRQQPGSAQLKAAGPMGGMPVTVGRRTTAKIVLTFGGVFAALLGAWIVIRMQGGQDPEMSNSILLVLVLVLDVAALAVVGVLVSTWLRGWVLGLLGGFGVELARFFIAFGITNLLVGPPSDLFEWFVNLRFVSIPIVLGAGFLGGAAASQQVRR